MPRHKDSLLFADIMLRGKAMALSSIGGAATGVTTVAEQWYGIATTGWGRR
jgi:hypothetical protein